MYAEIKGTGSYVPEKILTNYDLSKMVNTSDEWISTRTGIKERRISQTDNTSDLCIKAGQKIIKNIGINVLDIELIIVATMTGDFQSPSTACMVQSGLGAKNAVAFDVNAACTGFIFALSVGEKYIKSGTYKNALIIGGEVMSKVLDYTDRTTCILFGDGAGAVFLEKSERKCFLVEKLYSDGSKSDVINLGALGLKNKSEENRYLKMEGRKVFDFAIKTIPKCIEEILTLGQVKSEEVKYFILHQANLRIIQLVARKLNIEESKFYININRYGNTSAGSIPIALAELVEEAKVTKGDKIVLVGFGGGLTWGSCLIEY